MEKVNKKSDFNTCMRIIKLFSWIGIFVGCFSCLLLLVLSTSYSLSVGDYSLEELRQSDELRYYTSSLNNYTYSETLDVFSNIDNHVEFGVFELVLPSIVLLVGNILLLVSSKKVLDFLKNVKSKKTLFTDEKYEKLQEIVSILDFTFLCLFFESNLLIWAFITVILTIILYLFRYCVDFQEKNNEVKKA